MSGAIGVLGFWFPHFYCNSKKKERQSAVTVELPFFVDLLALSTEAGLDFFGAIQKNHRKRLKIRF